MASAPKPVQGIFPYTDIQVRNLLHDIADERSLNFPPLEDTLLKKSDALGRTIVEQAQERLEKWRKNIERVREHRAQLRAVREHIRTDKTLVPKQIARKQIERYQKKIAAEEEARQEHTQKLRDRQAAHEIKQREVRAEHAQEEAKRIEHHAQRLEKERTYQPPLEEIREKARAQKKEITENAYERIANKKESLIERRKELQNERRQEFENFLKDLEEKLVLIAEIEERAQQRAAVNASLLSSPDEKGEEQRELLKQIRSHRERVYEENLQGFLRHFEKLKKRMETFFEHSQKHRTRARTILKSIIASARVRSEHILLASGNPKAEQAILSDLAFFAQERARVNDILSKSAARREEAVAYKELLVENARERRDYNMYLSGHPTQLFKVLGNLSFFLQRQQRELFSIIENALKRSEYLDLITGLPSEKKNKIHTAYYHIIAFLLNPKIISSDVAQNVLAVSRHNPVFIVRQLVERVFSLRMTYDLIARLAPESSWQEKDLLETIQSVLKQENMRSIMSGMLVDNALQAELFLKEQKPASDKEKGHPSRLSTSFFETVVTNLSTHERFAPLTDDILLDSSVYARLTDPLTVFDSLDKEIDEGVRKSVFEAEDVFKRENQDERIKEEHEKQETEKENERLKKLQTDQKEKHNYFLKLIEEQNMTAHEKMVNEDRLIDFFF